MRSNRREDARKQALLRQIAHLTEQGLDLEQAVTRVRQELGEDAAALHDLLQDGDGVQTLAGAHAGEARAILLGEARRAGGSPAVVHVVLSAQADRLARHTEGFRRAIQGTLAYLGSVLTVLIVVTLVMTQRVLPLLIELLGGMRTELPPLAQALIDAGGFLSAGLAILSVLVIVGLARGAMGLRRCLENLRPLAASASRLPLVRAFARRYHEYLLLSYANGLCRAGVTGSAAVDGALRVSLPGIDDTRSSDTSDVLGSLRLAERLGTLAREIEEQLASAEERAFGSLLHTRETLVLVFQITIGIAVGLLVYAYYQPIFFIGGIAAQ